MGTAEYVAIGLAVWSAISTIVGYLFLKTDNRQESDISGIKESIRILYEKNNTTYQTLVGEYIKRAEFDAKLQRLETDISAKLDKILDKLEKKADRQ